ncbi:MAG: hypothetical protein QXT36_03530 [Candidatus Micrarchaeaceae archaeon]
MDEYEVIEHRLKANGGPGNGGDSQRITIIKALNFKLPTCISFSSSIDLQVDTKIHADENVVYADNKAIGEVASKQCGTDVAVNSNYDIKYTGGYSKDGKVIYIDRDMPKTIKIGDKDVDLIQSIALHHEVVEKWLIDDAYDYQYAHAIATRIEKEYIESLGINWDSYDAEVGKVLRQIYSKKLKTSPKNLDLTPYLATNDQDTLKEIRESLEI